MAERRGLHDAGNILKKHPASSVAKPRSKNAPIFQLLVRAGRWIILE